LPRSRYAWAAQLRIEPPRLQRQPGPTMRPQPPGTPAVPATPHPPLGRDLRSCTSTGSHGMTPSCVSCSARGCNRLKWHAPATAHGPYTAPTQDQVGEPSVGLSPPGSPQACHEGPRTGGSGQRRQRGRSPGGGTSPGRRTRGREEAALDGGARCVRPRARGRGIACPRAGASRPRARRLGGLRQGERSGLR
jgi:hypothetical protein